jgi:ribosome biogenesis GTPase
VGEQQGTVIAVYRGECQVLHGDGTLTLRLIGRQAHRGQEVVIGDEVTFDAERAVVLDVQPRRTRLARRRPGAPHREQLIAANVDRLAIVASVGQPPFRSGAVDRFLLAAHSGGLEPLLVVNKIDQLTGPLPEEISGYAEIVPLYAVSALRGDGLDALRQALAGARTVLAGHSGVGKTALLNALAPGLQLATGELARHGRGRHTTARSIWVTLGCGAVVIDTPGVREIASQEVDPKLIDSVYPDIARWAPSCRFRDCRHAAEPGCAVREAIASGAVRASRLAGYRRLLEDA